VWLKKDLMDADSQEFAKDVLNHMRKRLSDYQELYGDLFNLEATPAESTAYRLAKHDKKHYRDIITATDGSNPYYTNSSHIPVGATDSITEALNIQNDLQVLYTSGTVFHTFLGQKLNDWQSAMHLVKKIAENYSLPYFTLTPTYSICKNHGYIAGEQNLCPICNEETEVYSRITGYYRPIKNWNVGKQAEFNNRFEYNINNKTIFNNSLNSKAEEIVNKYVDSIMLFTTDGCPKCRMVQMLLDKSNIKYTIILADKEVDKSLKYQVNSVPALVSFSNEKVEKLVSFSNIANFINNYHGN